MNVPNEVSTDVAVVETKNDVKQNDEDHRRHHERRLEEPEEENAELQLCIFELREEGLCKRRSKCRFNHEFSPS